MQPNTTNRTIAWILGAILVIALIVIAFLIGTRSTPTGQVVVTPGTGEPSPVTTPQPTTPSAPAGYKTYSNTAYGFSFNYPQAWILNENPSIKTVTLSSNTNYVQGSFSTPLEKITYTLTDKSYFNP